MFDTTKDRLCLRCVHYIERELDPYWHYDIYGGRKLRHKEKIVLCKAKYGTIQTYRTKCTKFISIKQYRFSKEGLNTVKLEAIPTEGERIDLDKLPKQVELIAVSEKMKPAVDGKAGGLVIKYKLHDGRTFEQKYTQISGKVLLDAMKKLELTDTEDLQQAWYYYELKAMRMGFPRMIPVKKAKR